jgi:DNA-binding MarR family transcriptional regulator
MQPLTADEQRAWLGLLRTHARITHELDEQLRSEHGLPLSSYDVLVQLCSAPGGELRMSELADAVVISRSGLTRLVDRLERDGLVVRRECPDDARGSLAVVSAKGRATLERAQPTHHAGIRRLFLEPLDDSQRRQLAASWDRLAD